MKHIGFIVGMFVVAFTASQLYAITVNPASNVTADSAATGLTIPYRDTAAGFAVDHINLGSKTIAQLLAITSDIGDIRFCSDCSPAKVVVATGTAAGNFADVNGGTFK